MAKLRVGVQKMEYEKFIQLRKAGKIRAGINSSMAMCLIKQLPMRYQAAYTFWSWIWILYIPAFICVSIFYKWWIGFLLLFIVTPIISRANKQSAMHFVLDHIQENKEFYEKLNKKNLLVFKEN